MLALCCNPSVPDSSQIYEIYEVKRVPDVTLQLPVYYNQNF